MSLKILISTVLHETLHVAPPDTLRRHFAPLGAQVNSVLGLQKQMNRIHLVFLGGLALVPAYGGQDSYLATSHIATWDFIQSVGGIRIGEPEKKENASWALPVVCDVSGLTTISQKPTTMNSGLVVTRMLYQVAGNEIHISVVLNTPLNTSRTSQCIEIVVSGVNTGAYRVLYEEPNKAKHALGTVTFK